MRKRKAAIVGPGMEHRPEKTIPLTAEEEKLHLDEKVVAAATPKPTPADGIRKRAERDPLVRAMIAREAKLTGKTPEEIVEELAANV